MKQFAVMLCHTTSTINAGCTHAHVTYAREGKRFEMKVWVTYLSGLAHAHNIHSLLQQPSNQPINSHVTCSRGYNLPPLSLGQNQSG